VAEARERERTAHARLSANAFDLRAGLADWILKSQEAGWSGERAGATKRAQDAREYARSLLDRFEAGLIDAATASPLTAAKMRTAYAQLRRAEIQFESYLADSYRMTQDQLRDSEHADSVPPANSALLDAGRESLRGCCLVLERVVEPTLVAEAKRLGDGTTSRYRIPARHCRETETGPGSLRGPPKPVRQSVRPERSVTRLDLRI
jgi:hypothetical protein